MRATKRSAAPMPALTPTKADGRALRRFLSALANDIRYQMKYGFYFLYAFISAIYIAALLIVPGEYKKAVASVIILTDPAMLGMFFIGGIWLLEKEEGLHGYWGISPLRPMEYILSKAVSLSVISTAAAVLIVLLGLRGEAGYLSLLAAVFTGSGIFTVIGLTVATYARSVNHYLLIASPPAVFFSVPPILAVFGISHPFGEILPGTALWRGISSSLGTPAGGGIQTWLILTAWLGLALYFANKRLPSGFQGGGKA